MNKQKIIVILGPTSSGKSDLGVMLARKFHGEIISADSRQVYKGLDIGSGKITPDTKNSANFSMGQAKKKKIFTHKGILHHCIDIVSPKKRYTVIDFKKCAEKAIVDIVSRGKIPIICGGTGFYIQAITGGVNIPEVKPDWKLRKKLEKMPIEKLFEMLKKLNPERAKIIDAKNPRRLIRAIEIEKGKLKIEARVSELNFPDFFFIGIKLPEKELKKKIENRVKKMVESGLIQETKKLRDSGLLWKRIYELGFEYKYPALFLRGKISREEMLEKMILENWHYAKRQMTWFKKYAPNTHWVSNPKEAEKLVKKFLDGSWRPRINASRYTG